MNRDEIANVCIALTDEKTLKSEIKYIIDCEGIEGFLSKVWTIDESFDALWYSVRDTVNIEDEDEDESVEIITPFAKKMQKIYVNKQKVAQKALRGLKKELYG